MYDKDKDKMTFVVSKSTSFSIMPRLLITLLVSRFMSKRSDFFHSLEVYLLVVSKQGKDIERNILTPHHIVGKELVLFLSHQVPS